MRNGQSAHEARTSSYKGKRYSFTAPPEDVRQCSLGKVEARHRIRGQLDRRGASIIRLYTCATFSSGEMRGSIGGSGYALRLKLHVSSHLAFFLYFFNLRTWCKVIPPGKKIMLVGNVGSSLRNA